MPAAGESPLSDVTRRNSFPSSPAWSKAHAALYLTSILESPKISPSVSMEPKPVQQPHPPIWFGGRHPDGLRRAVEHGNGWMGAGSTTTEQFKEHVQILRQALESADKDPSEFDISKRVYIAIDDDADRAERRLREWFGQWYGNEELGSRVSIWGSVAQCVEGLMDLVNGGAQMLMLNPMFDHMEHLEAFSSEVIPQLILP